MFKHEHCEDTHVLRVVLKWSSLGLKGLSLTLWSILLEVKCLALPTAWWERMVLFLLVCSTLTYRVLSSIKFLLCFRRSPSLAQKFRISSVSDCIKMFSIHQLTRALTFCSLLEYCGCALVLCVLCRAGTHFFIGWMLMLTYDDILLMHQLTALFEIWSVWCPAR